MSGPTNNNNNKKDGRREAIMVVARQRQTMVLRWCCYGLLWVVTILAIAAVATCDFIRFSFDHVDITDGPDSPEMVANTGMFCYTVDALDVDRARSNAVDGAFSSLRAARMFAVLAALTLPIALVLMTIVYFCQLSNPTTTTSTTNKHMWWTIRILTVAGEISVLGSFSFYKGNTPCNESNRCGAGAGTILSALNVVLLLVLVGCLFMVGPPSSALFRCCALPNRDVADPATAPARHGGGGRAAAGDEKNLTSVVMTTASSASTDEGPNAVEDEEAPAGTTIKNTVTLAAV